LGELIYTLVPLINWFRDQPVVLGLWPV
jgi:hypothetical protein